MLTYIWFCVLLRAAVPGADHFIADYNATMTKFISVGLEAAAPPPPAERRRFSITTERRGYKDVAVAIAR